MTSRRIHARGRWVVLLSLTLMATLGCKKLVERIMKEQPERSEPQLNPATTDVSEQGPSEEEQRDYALAERISGHIDCLNFASRDGFRAKRGYFRYIDPEKGPTGKENGIYLAKMTTSERCVTALDKAKGSKPSLPKLDQVSDTYRLSLKRLSKEVSVAHTYYNQKDFKDDNFAKGKQMHSGLMDAFAEFERAHDAFDAEVKSINSGLSQRRLKRLEKDSSAKLEYLSVRLVEDAKVLIKFVDVEQLSELDEAGFKKALDQYESSVNSFENFVDANPAEATKVVSLSFFRSQAAEFLETSKELLRNKRDGKKLEAVSSPETTEGHPVNVLNEFNGLINRSNDLTFRR